VNDPIDDKALQEYLSGNSPLSQHYRDLDASEVPAHLDEMVLKQSREAVASAQPVSLEQSRLRKSRQRWVRWSVPATLAASTVLVVSIVIESGNRHEVTAEAPAAAVANEERAVNTPELARDEYDKAEAQTSTPASPPLDKRSLKAAPSARARKADAAAAMPSTQAPSESEQVAVTAMRKQQSPVSPAPVVEPEPPAPTPPLQVQLPASMARNTAAPPEAAAAPPVTRREQSASGAADSRQATEDDLAEVSVTGSKVNRPSQAIGPRGTITSGTAFSARSDESDRQPRWRTQPESWLAHIRQMRKDGPADEADKEWELFRAEYPDYAVAETDSARVKK
jgi:hypothetical protein